MSTPKKRECISVPQDFTTTPEYAAWMEGMARHCRCYRDCPCDGVLAGGLCDGLTEDDERSIFDAEDDL